MCDFPTPPLIAGAHRKPGKRHSDPAQRASLRVGDQTARKVPEISEFRQRRYIGPQAIQAQSDHQAIDA